MNFEKYNIRFATKNDAQEILEILRDNILHQINNFIITVPDVEEIEKKIETVQKQYPYLVAYERKTSKIAGFSYGSSFREREGYRFLAETSVYVHKDHRNNRISDTLYDVLISLMRQLGYKQLIAVISVPNPSSIKLHQRKGFQIFGTLEKAGNKRNILGMDWIDVAFYRLILSEFNDKPYFDEKPKSIKELDIKLENMFNHSKL